MPAPTKHPDWATDGTNVVEPPAGKVAAGWVPNEQPPSGWFNWWQGIVGQWTRWLESLIATLTGRVSALETDMDAAEVVTADAARKSFVNTFTKVQIINSELNWADDPLISTQFKPGDDPRNSANRWKHVIAAPTQGSARASIYVGQSPYGAAFCNNARWDVATQQWQQLDGAYPSTAMVGRSGQYVVSVVPAGGPGTPHAPWTDWPLDTGGDFIAGGSFAAHDNFTYLPAHVANDWTIPLSCSSGETFLQSDGSYKVGPDGASWPLKVPDGTVLTDIYVCTYQASSSLAYAALMRRDKGIVVVTPTFPAQLPVAEKNGISGVGMQTLTLSCAGHVAETASWEYSVIYKRAHADDKVGRIAMNQFINIGPRNLG